jgi:hypothetical protein
MQLRALYLGFILLTSSSSVRGSSRTLGSNVDHKRRDDATNDIFASEVVNLDEAPLLAIASENDWSFEDANLFLEDGSGGEIDVVPPDDEDGLLFAVGSASEDDLGSFSDENWLFGDGSSSANPNDLEPFIIADPSEELAQASPCAQQPAGKRDVAEEDLIWSNDQYISVMFSNRNLLITIIIIP